MTTRELEARRYIRRCRRRRRAQQVRRQRIALFMLAFCITLFCLWLSACHKDKPEGNTEPVIAASATVPLKSTPVMTL